MTKDREKLMSVEEVAEYLGLHPQTVYSLLREGELRGHKLGRVWRIRPGAVDEYIERQAAETEEEA